MGPGETRSPTIFSPRGLGAGGDRLPTEPGPTVTPIDRQLLTDNIVSVARLAKAFDLPVVLSTINVAHGRKKLVMTTLWTEVCLAFPTLDAVREGFEIYPVVDAVGGTSPEAHRAGLERIVQAGAQPISWVSLACELQRDWARLDTVADVVDIVLTTRLLAAA
jgi:hypothetical protein